MLVLLLAQDFGVEWAGSERRERCVEGCLIFRAVNMKPTKRNKPGAKRVAVKRSGLVGKAGTERPDSATRRAFMPKHGGLAHRLGERVKELSALHRAVHLLQDSLKPVSTVLLEIASFMPPAWQYPEVTEACITFDGRQFHTPGFRETPWIQRAAFATPDGRRGMLEVVYTEKIRRKSKGRFWPKNGI